MDRFHRPGHGPREGGEESVCTQVSANTENFMGRGAVSPEDGGAKPNTGALTHPVMKRLAWLGNAPCNVSTPSSQCFHSLSISIFHFLCP